jgi:pilus assembly protein CpaE
MHTVVLIPTSPHPLGPQLHQVLCARFASGAIDIVLLSSAEDFLTHQPADLLVVVLSPAPEAALAVIQKARPSVHGPILGIGQTTNSRLILRALHEGADHYIDENDLETQLLAVLHRLYGHEEPAPAASKGKVVGVLGASGGCGTSTLAVNLAALLAREDQRCALVDLKPGSGDLAALLDLTPVHSLADLCLNAGRMDRAMLEAALMPHSCGIHLLGPPQAYDEIRLVTTKGVQKVLALLRELFPYIVVDLEDCFHEEQVFTLRQAEAIFLVFRLDFTALRNTRRILDYLRQIEVPADRVRLVINRHGQASELPHSEAQEALGCKIAHFIPDDPKTINGANNTGVPVVVKAPTTKVALSLGQLAAALKGAKESSGPNPGIPRKSGWLASLY